MTNTKPRLTETQVAARIHELDRLKDEESRSREEHPDPDATGDLVQIDRRDLRHLVEAAEIMLGLVEHGYQYTPKDLREMAADGTTGKVLASIRAAYDIGL